MNAYNDMDFMIFEDERSQMETLRRSISKRFPHSEIYTEDNPYSVFHTISLFRPKVLIVDYQFRNMLITDESSIMSRIIKFKGLVVIYSSHDPSEIKKDLILKYGSIQKNLRIISKRNPVKLMKEIFNYDKRRNKGLGPCINITS